MNIAAEIRIRAERHLGEMLGDMEKNKGTRGQVTGSKCGSGGITMRPPEDTAPTLSDMGISKSMSSRAQQTAAISEEVFEAAIETQKKTAGKELTSSTILRIAAKERRGNPGVASCDPSAHPTPARVGETYPQSHDATTEPPHSRARVGETALQICRAMLPADT